MRILITLLVIIAFYSITLGQDVLFDDVNNCHELEVWSFLLF
ncbi:MAG: hypothetical protein ACLFSQ_04625 [Candidatus Zixiibacteriota bacterium]